MGRDTFAAVAVGAIDDTAPPRVGAQPEQRIVQLGDRIDGCAAQLVERALDALKRKIGRPGVVPHLGRAGAKEPGFAVINVDRDQLVGSALGAGEVERIDAGAVQQAGHPNALAVGLIEDKVPIQIADRRSAGEIRVANRRKRARGHVVDVAVGVCRNENLRAVVGNGYRAGAVDGAEKRAVVRRVDLVEAVA